MTGPGQWDPKVLDHNLTNDPDWYGQIAKDNDDASDGPFDEKGEYKNRVVSNPSAGDHEVREPGLDDPDGMERPDARDVDVHDTETTKGKQGVSRVAFKAILHQAADLNLRYICFDTEASIHDQDVIDDAILDPLDPIDLHPKELHPIKLSPGKFGPHFLAVPIHKIRRTFERTTQW